MPSQEYENILELLDSMPDTSDLSFEERRSNFEEEVAQLPVAEKVSCEPLSVDGIPAEWIIPEGAPEQRVLLYLHGGGYCIGSISTHRGMVSHIARAAETRRDFPVWRSDMGRHHAVYGEEGRAKNYRAAAGDPRCSTGPVSERAVLTWAS